MTELQKRLGNLLTVKSIVTILLTLVFCYLAVIQVISGELFVSIFVTVIGFYFGTQSNKSKDNSTPATQS